MHYALCTMNPQSISVLLKKVLADKSTEVLSSEAACKQGESFVADLRRIWYTCGAGNIEGGIKSLIVKLPPPAKAIQLQIMDCLTMFENEVTAYKFIIPHLQKINQKKTLPVPRCYYADNSCILLEDLSPGYGMVAMNQGLSLQELQVALKAISEFHAASFILKAEHEEQFELLSNQVKETVFTERHTKQPVNVFWETALKVGIRSLEASSDPSLHKVAQVYRRYQGRVLNTLRELTHCKNSFRVICHGDLWTSNVLIRYNENGDPGSARLIDLQAVRNGSCALDILHIICSSSQPTLFGSDYLHLISYYYDTLQTTLAEHNQQVPFSCEELVGEVKNRSPYGILVAFIMIQSSTNTLICPCDELEALLTMDTVEKDYASVSELYHLRIRQMVKGCIDCGLIQV